MPFFTRPAATAAVLLALSSTTVRPAPGSARPFSLDDEMKLRSIVAVAISPDGDQVAYVVSTPSLAANQHEPALYVIPSGGGTPLRIGDTLRIFNIPAPAPRMRWTPDGREVALLAFAGDRPQ